jgi:uncharacterized SAM-binding protein YcdF (DUF218 family)
MSDVKPRRTRRVLVRAIAGLPVAAFLGTLAFLPFAGRYLVVSEPLERSDGIVVLAGGRAERWLEAVDLYREGWAPKIALSPGRLERTEKLLIERGVKFPTDAQVARDVMTQLNVDPAAILVFAENVDNTAQEADAFRAFILKAGWTRIIVVTSKYHTRRTRFAFSREFRDMPVRILVRASRYDASTPERWWTSRGDVRYVTSELQKLVLYRFGLAE